MSALWIEDLFEPAGRVVTRRMFGGVGIWLDDAMVAIAVDGTVWMKTDGATAEAFRAAGSPPFAYSRLGKPVVLGFHRLPEAALDDPDEFRRWATLASAAAGRSGKRRARR
jgi:DNA transformation protein